MPKQTGLAIISKNERAFQMKLLIISATAGQGHNAIAQATANYYKKHHPEVEVRLADLFLPEHRIMAFLLNDFHFFMLRFFPRSMRRMYHQSMTKKPSPDRSFSYFFSKLSFQKYKKIIAEYEPDAIFCTHVFAACLIRYMSKKGMIQAKTYFIISDFAIHPDSESAKDFDYIFTPNELVHERAKHYLFREEQLRPFGLPSDEVFSKQGSKHAIRKELNIEKDAFVILLTNGGMGAGNNLKILRQILLAKSKLHVIVVNGKNKEMERAVGAYLIRHPALPVTNFGFTNRMHDLLEASDCMIGKLGGASTFESFVKEVPIIVPFKPPFHEYWNLLFMLDHHAVKYVKSERSLAIEIDNLVKNPQELDHLKAGVRLIKKESATKNICEFILKTSKLAAEDVV